MEFTINFSTIDMLVVFGATFAANILGGLWYSPVLFGRIWRAKSDIGPAAGEVSPGTFVASFILHLISATMLAALLGPSATGLEGMQFGGVIGVSFVMTATGSLNLFERRSLTLVAINVGYPIVSLSMMGYIIGTWG